MSLLPIFLNLEGRRCLLIGAGAVAYDKIGTLLLTGARLRVVAPEARAEIRSLASDAALDWIQKSFEPSDLDGACMVIAATNSPDVNTAVYRAAIERDILCNSVDDIPNCDFFFAAIVRRGPLQIAISTSGESPAFAQQLRREIDALLPHEIGDWLADLGRLRRQILASLPPGKERKLLLHRLAQPRTGSVMQTHTHPESPRAIAGETQVWLVGAGPGDPDLLTVKALRIIERADVILHDDLVPQAILDLATQAEIVNVGKRCGLKNITQEDINALMIDYARAGRSVVRLKCGDPLIFGRAAEEMYALRAANVKFEVVPGITSALAAAAAIPASLTDRGSASNVIFSTGHHAQSHNEAPLPAIEDATRVVYMPGRNLSLLAAEWLAEGLPADFPCVLVSRAAQPDQEVRATTLAALPDETPLRAPSLLIAGWAIANAAARTIAIDAVTSISA